jgi:uncharacterized protein YggE
VGRHRGSPAIATNTIQVEVRSIENIGKVIDAALGAGATNVGSVGLYASNTDAVRLAVTKALAKPSRRPRRRVAR